MAWALSVCFLFLNTSCAILNTEEFRRDGRYYINHFNSCGPKAIQNTIKAIENEFVSRESISKDIQNTGNATRLILASINHEALEITFPCELKNHLTKKGYKIKEVSFDSLGEGDVAIVLIRGSNVFKDWHWISYPTYSKEYIKKFYASTEVVKVYLITKS